VTVAQHGCLADADVTSPVRRDWRGGGDDDRARHGGRCLARVIL
jgi:hypothetical protein